MSNCHDSVVLLAAQSHVDIIINSKRFQWLCPTIIIVFCFLCLILSRVQTDLGTSRFSRLLVVGNFSFRRLLMSNYVGEYDIPLNSVFRCSSWARCGSLPSYNVFHIIIFTVCTNLRPLDCGYRGLLMMRENSPKSPISCKLLKHSTTKWHFVAHKTVENTVTDEHRFKTLKIPVVVLLDSWWTLGYLD